MLIEVPRMKRVRAICLILFGSVMLAAPAQAVAEEIPAPTLKVKAAAVPIPGFPGTGNFYGKGADVEATLEIAGSGYGATSQNPKGSVPPVSAVNVYLPKGVKLHQSGFGSCAEATLKNIGPSGCPKSSVASPLGSVLGEVYVRDRTRARDGHAASLLRPRRQRPVLHAGLDAPSASKSSRPADSCAAPANTPGS